MCLGSEAVEVRSSLVFVVLKLSLFFSNSSNFYFIYNERSKVNYRNEKSTVRGVVSTEKANYSFVTNRVFVSCAVSSRIYLVATQLALMKMEFPLYMITTCLNIQVTRIKEVITEDKLS